jgi:hypothetical protein
VPQPTALCVCIAAAEKVVAAFSDAPKPAELKADERVRLERAKSESLIDGEARTHQHGVEGKGDIDHVNAKVKVSPSHANARRCAAGSTACSKGPLDCSVYVPQPLAAAHVVLP